MRKLPQRFHSRWTAVWIAVPNAVHRTRWTPLCKRGTIVDVLGVVAVIASISALAPLPELPAQGLAVEEKNGVAFVDFRGRRLAALPGLEFLGQDTDVATGLPRFRDAQGGLWRVDRPTHRFVAAPDGLPLAGGAKLDFVPHLRTWFVRREGRAVLRIRA